MENPTELPPDIDYRPPQPAQGLSSGAKWGIGCGIGCLVTLLIAGVIGYLAFVKVREAATAVLDQFSSKEPIVFAPPAVDEATVEALVGRYDRFRDALEKGEEAEPLSLSGEEINLLLHHHPDWEQLAGHTSVAIEGEQLRCQVSLPLDEVGPLLKGRYINGEAKIGLRFENGRLDTKIESLEVANQSVPPEVIAELEKDDVIQAQEQNPAWRALINRLESIRVENGRLFLEPKPAAERQPPPVTPPEESASRVEAPVEA